MSQPRPKATWAQWIAVAFTGLAALGAGCHFLGVSMWLSVFIVCAAGAVVMFLIGRGLLADLRLTALEDRAALPPASTPPEALPSPVGAPLVACSRCGTDVHHWFTEALSYGHVFGSTSEDICRHCTEGWPYPMQAESEDEYILRLKDWRAERVGQDKT